MRSFTRANTLDPVPGDIVSLLRRIDRAAGAEARHVDQLPQLLSALQEQARIESVTASSAIEGVHVAEGRVPNLLSGNPQRIRNRSEAEFAGYSAALDYLNQRAPGGLTVRLCCISIDCCSPSPTEAAAISRPRTTWSSTATPTAAPAHASHRLVGRRHRSTWTSSSPAPTPH